MVLLAMAGWDLFPSLSKKHASLHEGFHICSFFEIVVGVAAPTNLIEKPYKFYLIHRIAVNLHLELTPLNKVVHPENVELDKVKVVHFCAAREDIKMLVKKLWDLYENENLDYNNAVNVDKLKEALTEAVCVQFLPVSHAAYSVNKKQKRRKWMCGKIKTNSGTTSINNKTTLNEAEEEQSKHALTVAIASAAAAEAAIAAAEVVRLTSRNVAPQSHREEIQESAAIKIQTAFRGSLV
ncbi:hypothetical protein RIF29_33449 [Crotalaria pallida]|uniref:Uncharacterized protein n=1 Tax=Crotalaria pallida TaxID=3830 RepID=A0AAN9HWT8_CROPI